MAEPWTSAGVGLLFTELCAGISKLITNYIDFEPLLGDLETTLVALNPLIQKINAQNRAFCLLPNEVIEKLVEDIKEGQKLVRKYSEAGPMMGCLKKPTTYTTEIRKLNDSLKKQLDILNVHELSVTNEIYHLVSLLVDKMEISAKDRQPNYRNDLVCYPTDSSLPPLMVDQNDAVLDEIKSKASTASGPLEVSQGGGGELLFNVLYDCHEELISRSMIDKPLLKDILCRLDSCGPMSKQIEECKKELKIPNEEVEMFKSHMERGIQNIEAWCAVPELPWLTVGFDKPLMELKMKLLDDDEMSMLVLTACGGCGKTTLATMVCQDEDVRDKFQNNIFFVTVSKTSNLNRIVKELYQRKGSRVPTFKDEAGAVQWLQAFLKEQGKTPLLLVLDNVRSGSEPLLEKFDFEMPNYKILVTSRSEFPRFGSSYHMQLLDYDNAMKLFYHSASLGDKSSRIPTDISVQMVKGCKGFPLAITVAGRSLCGQPIEIWQKRLIEWSKGFSILDSETELLSRLQSNLAVLDKEMPIIRKCFLDLGSFPEDQRIPVTTLIDIWSESYGQLDEDLCFAFLRMLTNQSLANLVLTRKDQKQIDGYCGEHYVTQHGILRELAIYEARRQDPGYRERLIINISGDNLPKWWSEKKFESMKARLLSISTDGLFSAKWHNMELPEAEVLILNFLTKNYGLPEFVENMDNLKVLVVTNNGFLPAELSNFQLLCSLSMLKRIRLERISIPSIIEKPIELKSLLKISLFMCNVGQAFSNGSIQVSYAFPNLEEMNIDYCNDLVEMPADLCDLIQLKKLSITNCEELLALPDEIGKLVNLDLLRLRSCKNLVKLPGSTKDLKKVKFLDISYCISIEELPEEIGEMSTLRRLSMIECSRLQKLPLSVLDLEQLMEVICDDKTKYLWEAFLPTLRNTHIAVAKENLNLNEQGTIKVKENSDSFAEVKEHSDSCSEEVGKTEVKEHTDPSTQGVVSGIEANFGIQNQSDVEDRCALPELPQPLVGLDVPLEESQKEILKDVNCSDDAHSGSVANDDILVPIQIASPLKIPKLRTVFPPCLRQPHNKKKRLEHKIHISSSDEPTLLSSGHNASTHYQHMSSPSSTITIEFCQEDSSWDGSMVSGQVRKHILPVDLERYGKEESSHLSRVGMQDMYLAMQRFHVTSTRLVQSEERIAVLETNYRKAEESWKLEKRKLSEQCNSAMAQNASLTKQKDSLAERIGLLEKNRLTARQEAQEILTNEWEPEFRRQMREAENDCFKLGCRVGFKSFLAKVENKFPNLDLSDISQSDPIEFDMKVIKDLLSPDYDNEADNSDEGTNHSDEEDGNDEERGQKSVAEEPGDVLERLYHFAVHDMTDGTTISFDMEKEVLGVANPMYILREDVTQFKEMTPISATCINVYMRHLYDVLKQSNIDRMVRFCDASSISVGQPYEKSQVLATRLQQLSTNQILLVPYNSGVHWTLTIINEEKDMCYFMDPIHSLGDPLEWKSIVNNGIEQWNNHQTGRAVLQKRPLWKILKGPKQPSNVECGYYVMRYMKEMVEDKCHSSAMKWDSKKYFSVYKETERAYTKTEVDEVRLEWASLVYEQKLRGLSVAGS